jgi:hypothetical protein
VGHSPDENASQTDHLPPRSRLICLNNSISRVTLAALSWYTPVWKRVRPAVFRRSTPINIRKRLMTDVSFAAYEGPLYRRILDIRLNGTPIGDLDLGFGMANCSQLDRDEIISVANVLVTVGYGDADMIKSRPGDAPDFVVRSPHRKALGVEHTRAVAECPDDMVVHFLAGATALREEPTVAAALQGLTVFISVEHSAVFMGPIESMTKPCPGLHMTRREARTAVDEVRSLVESGYLRRISGEPRSYIAASIAPTLARFRATTHAGPSLNAATFTLRPSAQRFLPRRLSLHQIVTQELAKKTTVAPGYITERTPGALVIQVKVGTQDLEYDLLDYEPPEIAPFTHVAIALWHNGDLIVPGWSRAADGSIEAFVPPLAEIPDQTDHELRGWADRLEEELRRRWYAESARSGERTPKIFMTPLTAQWYRNWIGPGPWVTCCRVGETIEMRFWRSEEGSASGTIRAIAIDDPPEAADKIWEYIVG